MRKSYWCVSFLSGIESKIPILARNHRYWHVAFTFIKFTEIAWFTEEKFPKDDHTATQLYQLHVLH